MRIPRSSGVPIASRPTSRRTPLPSATATSWPGSSPYRYVGVSSTDTSPYACRTCSNSLVGPAKSRWLSRRPRTSPSCASSASSSAESGVTPARAARPASARDRNGSGQPPGGSPSSPPRNPITESGMSNDCGSAANSAGSAPAATRCSARSPTTFDDGVTFTSRPRIRSAAAYIASICSNRSPRPSAIAC
ncbi:Uncharacterised protein [Mycobacteroides abscessus]|nr:Uncharacterised protein [Mycobacteroides abscessus]